MIVGVHHVQLIMPAGREGVARAFYGELLGMREVPKPPALAARGGVWFRSGSAELHVGVEDPCRPPAKAHPGLLVDDLDAALRRLAAGRVSATPDALLPGFRRAYVRDPFGNRLELLEPA